MPKSKKTTTPNIYEALAAVPARVDRIIHLRTMVIDGSASDALDDLCDRMDENELKRLLPPLKDAEDITAFLDGDMGPVGDAVKELQLFGFIIQISTPVVNATGGYSWGYTTGAYFYADTYEDALKAGVVWATQIHEEGTHA